MRKIVVLFVAIAISASLALAQTVYRPSAYDDLGNERIQNPTYAYDGNSSTYASLSGVVTGVGSNLIDECVWSGFPSYTSSSSLTLNITLAVPDMNNGIFSVEVAVSGVGKASFSYTSLQSETTVQWTVPAGTNLDTITVTGKAQGLPPEGGTTGRIYEIWIQ
jgi:hypothetical protein